MSEFRIGRVNALASAIFEAGGDEAKLAERLRFFSDLTEEDVRNAVELAQWFQTEAGQKSLAEVRELQRKEGAERD